MKRKSDMARRNRHRISAAPWLIVTGLLLLAAASSSAAATLSLPPDAGALPAQATVVPLLIDDATGVLSTDIFIRYNPAVAMATAVNQTSLSAGHTLFANLMVPGEIRIALFGPSPLSGGGVLLDLSFTSVGALNSQTPLEFLTASLNESMIATTAVDGSYCVQGVPSEVLNVQVTLDPVTLFATLSWPADPFADEFNMYRATQKNLSDLSCLISGIPGTATSSPDDGVLPAIGSVQYYLMTSKNCRLESTLGFPTSGPERIALALCP